MSNLEDIVEEMSLTAEAMIEDAKKAHKNKAAALRARKYSLTLAEIGKQFRKASIEHHKK